jgi:hypothetical protein
MRKTFKVIILLLAIPVGLQAHGIVNNSTTSVTSEDSISYTLFNLDSLGQNIGGLDTTHVLVRNGAGDSVFSEVVSGVGGRVTMNVNAGDTSYCWSALVADIDGSGAPGLYTVAITSKSDQTGGWLKTPIKECFQLVGWELDDVGDSTGMAARHALASLDSLDKVLTRMYTALDSIYAVLDTLQDGFGSQSCHSVCLTSEAEASLAAQTADSVLVDSLSYQGSGANVDSTKISRWVWNTPQGNHGGDGTFGKFLDTEVSGVSSGSGIYSFAVHIHDSGNGQVIPYVDLAVRNVSQTALVAVGRTDSEGRATFNLNADSFIVAVSAAGYVFSGYDTLVVDGGGSDTLYGYSFDPGSPSIPSLCRVYGFLYDITGKPRADVLVSASLPAGVARTPLVVVSPFSVTTNTDANGYFYLDLIPSALLIPEGGKYEIAVSARDGTILKKRLAVPTQPHWQLIW